MKKLFSAFAAALLIVSILLSFAASAETLGDYDGSENVTSDDAVYLLRYTLFPGAYPLDGYADFDHSGSITSDDAVYLLRHTLFPEAYPLTGDETVPGSDIEKSIVDGAGLNMRLSITRSRLDDERIGDDWSYITEVNGEPASEIYMIAAGDTLNFYARFTEQDSNPDIGEADATYIVTEEDLINGFSVSLELYVTENGGRYRGRSAHFIVIFSFSAE